MPRPSHKTLLYAAAGALGGSAAWSFVLTVSGALAGGIVAELILGAIAGLFIGGFIWSREAITGRQFRTAAKRATFGAAAGILGGAAGSGLGNTIFTGLGRFIVDLGGLAAPAGIAIAVGLGWAILGAFVGASGGIMIRSRERVIYGLAGGSLGGLLGGLLFNSLSATSAWSSLAGLFMLGLCIGAFISLVEEAFVSAKVKVIKGRHIGREFMILKETNVIGRDDRSDVCLSGAEGVGMRHAYITKNKGRYSIDGAEDGTGLYVNNKLTKNSRLSDGDVIRVGSIILAFSAVRKAAAVIFTALLFWGMLLGNVPARADEPANVQITQFDLSGFPLVKAYVSVLDKAGKPVKGLTRRDVTLFAENGRPVSISEMRMSGSSGKREPLSLSIVMDRSGSMTGEKLFRSKESVFRFISLMEDGDRASLFAFSDEVEKLQALTGDRDDLKKSAETIQPGGHTALYDAIARGVESVRGVAGRRAVIVLSDGIANRGVLNIDQAIEAAAKGNVSVYVIGLGEDVREARLGRISRETGGSYFFTPSAEGLAEIYETISKRIRNEYIVTYQAEKRAEYLRNVTLSIASGQMASRAYFQPESSLFGAGGGVPGWSFAIPIISIAGLLAISLRNIERRHKAGHLSLVRGKGARKEMDVTAAVTIGRDERNSLGLFKDVKISQFHAQVARENGRCVIEDRGSASGTYVNQKKIAGRQTLGDGDIIDIGDARLVFSEESRQACSACGAAMRAGAKFCRTCGRKYA